jgi:predicted nuclease with TOPRIM domain
LYLKNNPCFSGSISYDEEGLPDFVTEIEEKCTFGGVRNQFYEFRDKIESFEGEKSKMMEKIEKLENEVKKLRNKIADYERFDHSGDQE